MELIKEYQEKKWQNASWVALKAVSPNFVNRARSGRQNDIRINGMKALKCCNETKRSYWKNEEDICEENIDMGKSCKGKTLPDVKQRKTAWFWYTYGILKKRNHLTLSQKHVPFRSPRIYHRINRRGNVVLPQHGFSGEKCLHCHNTSYVFKYQYQPTDRVSGNY